MIELYKIVIAAYKKEAQKNTYIDKILCQCGIISREQLYSRINSRMLVFNVLKIGFAIIIFSQKK